jgi:hypothetical protein
VRAHSERKAMNPIMKSRRMPMNQSSIMTNMAHPYSCHLTWARRHEPACKSSQCKETAATWSSLAREEGVGRGRVVGWWM